MEGLTMTGQGARREKRIGDYVILDVMGRGATATVYRAAHSVSGRQVALKLFAPEAIPCYQRELRMAPVLDHPNLVAILDHGIDPRGTYIVSELVRGETLEVHLGDRLQIGRALQIVADIAAALAHLHARGIVHGDVKPSNVIVDEESDARLIDLGSALPPGTIVDSGTPTHMSPEQARGVPIDVRSDVYSLGVVLYELLSGHVPFDGNNAGKLMAQHIAEPAPMLTGVPHAVAALVARCLEKKPSQRFESMEALLEAIQEARKPATSWITGVLARLGPRRRRTAA